VIAALALSLVLAATPAAPTDRATFYGGRCPEGVSFLGRTDTCSPYVAKRNGGRGGERWMYAAVGWFRWGMKPVEAIVRSKKTGKEVRVIVRDHCAACRQGRVLIDLSPMAFSIGLGLTLGEGVARVEVRYLGAR
jgi:hypothetical protein